MHDKMHVLYEVPTKKKYSMSCEAGTLCIEYLVNTLNKFPCKLQRIVVVLSNMQVGLVANVPVPQSPKYEMP